MRRNVRLLKWAHYYGMAVGWNILAGFPGEWQADYDDQVRLVPLLTHLPPPSGCGPLWLERFSPYFTDPTFPVSNVRPRPAYRFIYPEDQIDVSKIAYFFDYEAKDVVDSRELLPLQDAVNSWKALWNGRARPVLVYQRTPHWMQIVDRRDPASPQAHSLHGAEANAYEYCGDTDRTAVNVAAHLTALHQTPMEAAEVEEMLRGFCERGLMIEEDGHFLSLALPVNPNW